MLTRCATFQGQVMASTEVPVGKGAWDCSANAPIPPEQAWAEGCRLGKGDD